VFSINDGTANNSADWRPNGGDFLVISGGATQADIYPGGITVNTVGNGDPCNWCGNCENKEKTKV